MAYRYWKLHGIVTASGALELSEARAGGTAGLFAATVQSVIAPTTGSLTSLYDDSAASAVRWSSCYAASFNLLWDLGTPGDVLGFRLGGGNSAADYPSEAILSASTDGVVWLTQKRQYSIAYPGNLTLSALPSTTLVTTPYAELIALYLRGNGANNGTVFTDNSPRPKALQRVGTGVVTSTAQKKLGTASLNGFSSTSYLQTTAHPDFDIAADFTVEFQLWLVSFTPSLQGVFSLGLYNAGLLVRFANNAVTVYIVGSAATFTGTIPLGQFNHFEINRIGSTVRVFINGTLMTGTFTNSVAIPAQPVAIGISLHSSAEYLAGYLDEVVFYNGVGLHSTAFTAPVAELNIPATMLALGTADYAVHTASMPPGLLTCPSLPAPTLTNVEAEAFSRYDPMFGGKGRIYGTVKEKHSPSNLPLRRKVTLSEDASGLPICSTWSDPATGDFEFKWLAIGPKFTTIAYDHTGIYRAVIADAQTAELIV